MKIQVLGSSGAELPGHCFPAFLLDDFMLLDAGTIGRVLDRNAQKKISCILTTHAHLDHIKGIPFLIDNMINTDYEHQITILSGRDVLDDIKTHIFNNKIWPDFTSIPDKKNPVMKYRELPAGSCVEIRNYKIYAVRVNHLVPSYGYIIEDPTGHALVYTGDTGPAESLWQEMNNHNVKALIIEVTFPDSMNKLALLTGHLTPSLLAGEMEKMAKVPEKVYITHVKPLYRNAIERELKRLDAVSIEILNDNDVISL